MKTFRVLVTRDCRMTQSATVEVQATCADDAEQKAMDIPQDRITWTDDDSFNAGEGGTYVADPDAIEEIGDALPILGGFCEACGKETACVDSRAEQVMCRDCAMRHDDGEIQS